MHINLKPLLRCLHFTERHCLPFGIVIDREMVARAKTAAVAHRLRNDNLAAAGKRGDHASKQYLPVGVVKWGTEQAELFKWRTYHHSSPEVRGQ